MEALLAIHEQMMGGTKRGMNMAMVATITEPRFARLPDLETATEEWRVARLPIGLPSGSRWMAWPRIDAFAYRAEFGGLPAARQLFRRREGFAGDGQAEDSYLPTP